MTEIRLVSHFGDRAVTGFDRTFETIDPKTVTPLVDIHHEGFGDTWVDRFFEIEGDYFLGGRFEDFLSGAEVDGTTVRFDGEIPHSHEDQCWTRLLVTEDSLFVSVPSGGQHPRRPLAVRRNGRPEVAMRSTGGPGHLDWMLDPRTKRKIVEPLGETEKVTVHDPSVTDLEGYLRERSSALATGSPRPSRACGPWPTSPSGCCPARRSRGACPTARASPRTSISTSET